MMLKICDFKHSRGIGIESEKTMQTTSNSMETG